MDAFLFSGFTDMVLLYGEAHGNTAGVQDSMAKDILIDAFPTPVLLREQYNVFAIREDDSEYSDRRVNAEEDVL
ncbi:hypothetical protein BDFB_007393 [Asbolus verrucosus]|uniref:Uncharacterized protein n=1 Tax=Asbolus verrucosus TaxID=1661398 RepID=A0A482VP90_ASBVE|nr:hypothetical protein BDFB_007393 [Asbolus verrucosus]